MMLYEAALLPENAHLNVEERTLLAYAWLDACSADGRVDDPMLAETALRIFRGMVFFAAPEDRRVTWNGPLMAAALHWVRDAAGLAEAVGGDIMGGELPAFRTLSRLLVADTERIHELQAVDLVAAIDAMPHRNRELDLATTAVDMLSVAVEAWHVGTLRWSDPATNGTSVWARGHALMQVVYGGGDFGRDEPDSPAVRCLAATLVERAYKVTAAARLARGA